MAAYPTIDGDLIQVYSAGVLIANGTDCKLAMKIASREVTTKDGGADEQYEYTKRGWTVSVSYLYADPVSPYGFSQLATLIKNRTKVTLKFGSVTSGQKYYTGTAIIESCDLSGPQKANITGAYSFKGDGAWTEFTNP